jgi:cellulose synthase/poly-beta-1,6-N-acetylglucosamine synthase-like glycosyltransferase
MPAVSWTGLLLFPALVALVLVALRARVYRRRVDVNAVFRRGRRSPALRPLLGALTLAAVGVFAALQAVRLPFLLGAVRALSHGDAPSPATAGAGLLLAIGAACELLAFAHLLFYLNLCRSSADAPRDAAPAPDAPPAPPARVAVLIPSCDEEPEVLARSLRGLARLGHAALDAFLVENSRDPLRKKEALATARRLGVEALDLPNRGSKAGALNDARPRLHPETRYVVVLDADQELHDDLLRDALPLLEADPGLAFVQSAQAYEDCARSLLALAAAQQQMLLYDCVLESKDRAGQAPCLGTNVVLRLAALDEVGGWDEENVTEDLSTSYRIHRRGHRSRYLRHIYATGLAPRDFAAYLRQQTRWAWGNTGVFLRLLGGGLRGPGGSLGLDLQYLWSSGFYVHTLVLAALGLAPTLALVLAALAGSGAALFSALPVPPSLYASLYALYVLILFLPFANMALRGYPLRNLLLVQGLATSAGPAYLRGVLRALFRRGAVFDPVRRDAPAAGWPAGQTISFAVFTATGALATGLAVAQPRHPIAWILAFWCLVHAISVGHTFLLRGGGTDR